MTAKPLPATPTSATTSQTVADDIVKKEAEEIAKASGEETVAEEAPATTVAEVKPEDEAVTTKE